MTNTNPTRFAHERLHVYRVSLDLLGGVERLAASFPRGHGDLKDQLRRAAAAVVLGIAEAAARMHARDKATRFGVARGECGECAAALDIARVIGIASDAETHRLQQLADRVSAMLMGLIRSEQRRIE